MNEDSDRAEPKSRRTGASVRFLWGLMLFTEVMFRYVAPIAGLLFFTSAVVIARAWLGESAWESPFFRQLLVVASLGFLLSLTLLIVSNRRKAREAWRRQRNPQLDADTDF